MNNIFRFLLYIIVLSSIWIPPKALSQLADTPWPMFLHDRQHTGRSPYACPDSVTLIWKFQTNGEVSDSPTIGIDGMIYFCTDEIYGNILYALYPSGSLKWKYQLNSFGTKSTPSIGSDGTVYVGVRYNPTNGSCLFAIDQNGNFKWKCRIGSYARDNIDSSPAIDRDGTIYIGSDSDTLYAINPNGTIKWRFGTGSDIDSSPAIANDGTTYIGSEDGYFYAIRPNGSLKWKYLKGDGYFGDSSPSIGLDGTIYVGSDDDNIYAFNSDGSVKWTLYIRGWHSSTPIIDYNGIIYLFYGALHAISPEGVLLWKTEHLSQNTGILCPIIDVNNTIYFSYNTWPNSKFDAVKPDGTRKWSFDPLCEITTSPCISSDGSIYIGTEKGLYCLGKRGGGEIPDLTISQISLKPDMFGTPGVPYEIIAEVKDLTNIASAYCTVSFYYDNLENFIDSTSIYVPTGMPSYAQVDWNTQNYESKDYVIIAKISNSTPPETNTTNNTSQIDHILLPFLQSRINSAQTGETVWADPGIYLEHVNLKSDVIVKSKEGNLVTIIDGNGSTPAVSANSISGALLDGFTVRNGNPCGIEIDLASVTITNNWITENFESFGWGIKLRGLETSWIENNVILNNNEGIYANNSNAIFRNNTIVNNISEGVHAIGFYVPSPEIANCIIWGNGDDLTYSAAATYSNIQDGDPGTGNISADPLFVDPTNNNYHLQAVITGYPQNSPCIDAGTGTDPDGTPADMGAYWVNQSGMFSTISGTITNSRTGNPIEGAMLILSGPESDTTWSNNNGMYQFMVQGGSGYSIEVSALNYQTAKQQNISATPGETTLVSFALQPYLEPPTNLQATVSQGKVTLEWQPPTSTMQEELAFDDGSFENAMGWDNMQGIAANGPFQSSNYPVSINIARVAFNGTRAGDYFKVHVYKDISGVADKPSSTMLAGTLGPLTISNSGTFQDVDLSSLNLNLTSGKFFIGIQQLSPEEMWIYYDENASGENAFIDSNLDGIFSSLNELDPPVSAVFAIRAIVSHNSGSSQSLMVKTQKIENVKELTETNTPENDIPNTTDKTKYLTWNDSQKDTSIFSAPRQKVFSDASITLNGYNLYRSQSTPVGLIEGNRIATVPQAITNYEDMDVVGGHTYYYVVTALYDAGESEPANEVSILVTSIVKANSNFIPKNFRLFQNTPNPFNPETTIKYQLPKSSEVSLKIYNLNGKLVKTLVNTKQASGHYSVLWDGKDEYGNFVSSGVYLYSIRTKEFSQIRKMILVR